MEEDKYIKNKELEVRPLNEMPGYETDPAGNLEVKRFGSYGFGGTFSRIIQIMAFTATVEYDSAALLYRVRAPRSRIPNTIIYGRVINPPNIAGAYWTPMQEQEPDSSFTVGVNPFLSFRFEDSFIYFTRIPGTGSYNEGDKVVIQLLFCEL